MSKDKNEELRDELGELSELRLAQYCEKLDLGYPLLPFYEKLEELIDKLSYELAAAEWCLRQGKSHADFRELKN